MEQQSQNHRILQTTGGMSETVKKLLESLEALLKGKSDRICELFSRDDIDSIERVTVELAQEGLVPNWSLGLSRFGMEVPNTDVVISLTEVKSKFYSKILKQAAKEALETLTKTQDAKSKTEPK